MNSSSKFVSPQISSEYSLEWKINQNKLRHSTTVCVLSMRFLCCSSFRHFVVRLSVCKCTFQLWLKTYVSQNWDHRNRTRENSMFFDFETKINWSHVVAFILFPFTEHRRQIGAKSERIASHRNELMEGAIHWCAASECRYVSTISHAKHAARIIRWLLLTFNIEIC